ncbi:MAG TPA: hypothetical protein PL166_13800, partial [Candidatus Contendobacter sp.]|nr:hypothetical protein [Candidatus Contendobacter sp.]HRD50654.1 hypothetical protein [Candidatus Contendobacter sp.]
MFGQPVRQDLKAIALVTMKHGGIVLKQADFLFFKENLQNRTRRNPRQGFLHYLLNYARSHPLWRQLSAKASAG